MTKYKKIFNHILQLDEECSRIYNMIDSYNTLKSPIQLPYLHINELLYGGALLTKNLYRYNSLMKRNDVKIYTGDICKRYHTIKSLFTYNLPKNYQEWAYRNQKTFKMKPREYKQIIKMGWGNRSLLDFYGGPVDISTVTHVCIGLISELSLCNGVIELAKKHISNYENTPKYKQMYLIYKAGIVLSEQGSWIQRYMHDHFHIMKEHDVKSLAILSSSDYACSIDILRMYLSDTFQDVLLDTIDKEDDTEKQHIKLENVKR